MAREAILRVGNIGWTVDITLEWSWLPWPMDSEQTWSCLPGWLSASEGTWTEHAMSNWGLKLYDNDGNWIAWASEMDVDLIGYPLAGLEGATGSFSIMRQGGRMSRMTRWEMLTV